MKKIVESIGDTAFGTSLMFFSISGMLPIPGISTLVVIPTGTIASQMIAGKKQIRLPKFILKRTVRVARSPWRSTRFCLFWKRRRRSPASKKTSPAKPATKTKARKSSKS